MELRLICNLHLPRALNILRHRRWTNVISNICLTSLTRNRLVRHLPAYEWHSSDARNLGQFNLKPLSLLFQPVRIENYERIGSERVA